MQPGVAGGDDRAAFVCRAAGPVGHDAPRRLDHRDGRVDIVGVQPGFDLLRVGQGPGEL